MSKELDQRAKPKQARAIKTYELILNTAAELLDRVGFEAFTTKLLAEKANLRIRSIYRYFPNKLAIIKALAERHAEKDTRFIDQYSLMKNLEINWQEAIDGLVDTYYEMQTNEPAYMAVFIALSGSPELIEYDDKSIHQYSQVLAKALKTRIPGISDEKLEIVSMNIIVIFDKMIWRAHKYLYNFNDKSHASEIIQELKLVLKSYLANYID